MRSTAASSPLRRADAGLPLLAIATIAALAALLMMWRWGGTIEDSQAYFDTVRFLRGELAVSDLRAPFPYRIGIPALVAALPFDARHAFAAVNWLCVSLASVMMGLAAAAALDDWRAFWLAALLGTANFCTFWYAPYLLVDPGSLLARSVFVYAIVTARPGLAFASVLAATAIREENIVLAGWLLLTGRVTLARGLMLVAACGLWLVTVRWYLVPGLPPYRWTPSVARIVEALHDVRSLATIAATSVVVVPLALLGMRRAPVNLKPLRTLLLFMALPPLYAMLSVRIDGRVVWGLYPFLVPFAVAWLLRTRIATGEAA
jgi:hypothetical protein